MELSGHCPLQQNFCMPPPYLSVLKLFFSKVLTKRKSRNSARGCHFWSHLCICRRRAGIIGRSFYPIDISFYNEYLSKIISARFFINGGLRYASPILQDQVLRFHVVGDGKKCDFLWVNAYGMGILYGECAVKQFPFMKNMTLMDGTIKNVNNYGQVAGWSVTISKVLGFKERNLKEVIRKWLQFTLNEWLWRDDVNTIISL